LRSSGTVSQPQPVGRPHLTFKPGEVQFPVSQSDGWVTVNERVLVVSDGTADVQQLGLRIAPTGSPFAYSGDCPTHLARQQTCTLQLTFQQKSQQAYGATIAAYDGSAPLSSLPMRGGGGRNAPTERPHASMTPTALKFGGTQFYAAMYVPRQTVEVRNDGAVDLRALNVRMDPSGAPFNYSNCPRMLSRGQSCTIQVNFTSANGGQSSATLSAYEGGMQLAGVQLYGAGSSAPPPKPPRGSVTGVVDHAYPSDTGTQSDGRTGNSGTAQGTKSAPSGPQSSSAGPNNAGSRTVYPNRVPAKVERSLPAPSPVVTQRPPVRRAVPKPPPPPPSIH